MFLLRGNLGKGSSEGMLGINSSIGILGIRTVSGILRCVVMQISIDTNNFVMDFINSQISQYPDLAEAYTTLGELHEKK